MRSRRHLLSVLLFVCIASTGAQMARAQTSTALGSCTGGLTGSVGLVVTQSDGTLRSVANDQISTAFGAAECQCATRDIYAQVILTSTLPLTPVLNFQVWVGSNCLDYNTRISATTKSCEDITNFTSVTFSNFVTGSATNGPLLISIPSEKLFTPGPPNPCGVSPGLSFPQNNIYLIFFSDPQQLVASCQLNLKEAAVGPTGAMNASAEGGDSAVSVKWEAPSSTSAGQPIAYYQVLCADDAGTPLLMTPNTALYSVCVDGKIKRRTFAGSNLTTQIVDAGVVDASSTDATVVDASAVDLSSTDMTTATDMSTSDAGTPSAFASLDPRFVCSDRIDATQRSFRVQGLTNGRTYQFSVLAIDAYGNATSSGAVTGVPIPTEDLYRRYYNAGGRASGFCFIATAAYGSYEHRLVWVLRNFRDQILLPTSLGRQFVDWYYAHSPPSAAYIADHLTVRLIVQIVLWPVIVLAAAILFLCQEWFVFALALIVVSHYVRKNRRRVMQ